MSEKFFFPKSEKLCSDKLIERLFSQGNREIGTFPVRLVYLPLSTEELTGINVMVSVSKRHFKRAVKRNRVKRQLREYYRLNSCLIKEKLAAKGCGLLMALIFTDSKLWPSDKLDKRLDLVFQKLVSAIDESLDNKVSE